MIGSDSKMSSNSSITHNKGPSDSASLPPYTRPRKDTDTKAENTGSMSTPATQRAEGPGNQLNGTVGHSPFARPGSRAGASTVPATPMEMPSASISPFAWPGSHAGSAQPDVNSPRVAPLATRFPNTPSSPVSSISGSMFQEDLNTSTSWDLIHPDCDAEVADITKEQTQPQVNQVVNASIDSTQAKSDRGLKQVSNVSLSQNLGTLYNQDFFIADTTGRRLSQIPHKLNYPYPLPNRHSALQLRFPDLLIYLKMDTYLIDVNTGDHYAVYDDRIEKMSILPKLYSAWGYRQLLQTIQNDATRFGVNSPQPSTSEVSQGIQTTSGQGQPSPVAQYMQPPPFPCRPTIVKYEPPSFSLEQPTQMLTRDECNQVLQNHVAAANAAFNKVAVFESLIQQEPHNVLYYKEVQRVQKNQHIHVAIKLQHILETDDQFRCSVGLPRLDLLEHLWGVRDMQSAHSREQDFMAIMAEIEVLHQQLKGKGMYTVPPALPSTSNIKPSNNVHFQPIDPVHKSPVQAMDQSLLNSSLNLLDDSPRLQSSSSNGSIPCGQTTLQGSVHVSNRPIHTPLLHASQPNVPPTPYVNQTAVNQHMGIQPTPIPPRSSTGPPNLQPPANTFPRQVPSNIQPQPLPFF